MIAVTQAKQIYFKFLPVSNIMRHYHNGNKSLAIMQQTTLIYSIIKLNMSTYSCFGGKVVYNPKQARGEQRTACRSQLLPFTM